ncbi:MAG: aldehyde dehydrogenase family protein [Armatimonadota bacterium]|nr:aldehyde dehydrogenase family protein [Armatimonadota bacterium]MDR7486406.1 aldehyde dehydrogenase family protein [Armatimonadota bacterium]MDR7532539.1 aldehyde dehydrogenase family protein [Armatimonadota bacterium]MDR7535572.1 aldehyde dehydrogenase family protein [Armatimonadota bacterium]
MALLVINGEAVPAKSGAQMPVLNPATEEVVDVVPRAGPDDVDAAVAAARRAFDAWAKADPDERAHKIREGLAKVRAHAQEVADLLVREQGKPLHEATGELTHFLHGMEFYADLASKLRGAYAPLPSALGRAYGLVIRRPVGVCAAIVPWNFPLTLMGTKIGPALATGNTVVVKPASTTPLATLRVIGLMNEAGLPPGVLNVVTGPGRAVGEALASHADVRRVAFTGQTATGRRIMELAGPAFKRITLELGGSDPVIVCSDADLDKAVRGVLIGRFWNCGQACLAAKRVYVFADVYDAFMEKLLAGVARYEPGEGWVKAERPKIRVGPLHTAEQRQEIAAQLDDAVRRGATVAYGGTVPEGRGRGYFFTPTVLTDAPHDSRVVQEETFGPLLPVFKVAGIDEAIRLANDSVYGLGSSIWTYNIKWIHRAAQELDAGMTWVNQLHYGYDELPFGGVKASGIGREHGPEAMDYYVEFKSVVVGDLE